MFWIGVLPALLTFLAGLLPEGGNAQVTNTNYELRKLSKNITKRENGCPEGQHREGQFCCLPCSPGERKNKDCRTDGGKLDCVSCLEGKDYTDSNHFSDKCRRCKICDGEHGLEVEENCTKTQNTKCRCKANFFCNTPPCEHCSPCSTCDHGVDEKCTPTNDTRCKNGHPSPLLWLIVPVILILALIVWRVKKSCQNKNDHHESLHPSTEMPLVHSADIDLNDYISTIAEQMKLKQVKEFARKNGMNEAKIDEIINDNLQDTAEQKVQLLRNWYQSHGRKNAYSDFIEGLRKANFCALTEKIQDIIKRDIANKHTNANANNENESQSLV